MQTVSDIIATTTEAGTCSDSRLATRYEAPKVTAAPSCARWPGASARSPGRSTIIAPASATAIASARRHEMRSPIKSVAPMVTTIGFRKPMAVTSATVIRAMAKNQSTTASVCNPPRSAKSAQIRGENPRRRAGKSAGTRKIRPKTKRMNAPSAAGSAWPSQRTVPFTATKHSPAISIHRMPVRSLRARAVIVVMEPDPARHNAPAQGCSPQRSAPKVSL